MDDETEIFDSRFSDCLLGNCQVERLYQGTLWAEGPVYFCDGDFLLWSDIPNDRMMKWTPGAGVTVFRQPSNYSNGHTRDRQGRLVSCEHGTRRVSPAPSGTAPSRSWPTPTKASGSTRPTTWW